MYKDVCLSYRYKLVSALQARFPDLQMWTASIDKACHFSQLFESMQACVRAQQHTDKLSSAESPMSTGETKPSELRCRGADNVWIRIRVALFSKEAHNMIDQFTREILCRRRGLHR